MRHLVIAATVLGYATGCSSLPRMGGKTSTKNGGSANADATPKSEAATATSAATAATSAELAGLAGSCKVTTNDQGKTCFICVPRTLPVTQCVATPAGFDPAKDCTHDASSISCNVGASAPFVFDLSQESQAEKIYDKIPVLVFAAKALLASQMQSDSPGVQALVNGALDDIQAHQQELFTGGDLTDFLTTLGALVKGADPNVSDADLKATETGVQAAVTQLQNACLNGNLDDDSVLTFFTQVLAAVPQQVVGQMLPNLNVNAVTANLKNSTGNDDVIATLLASLGSGASVDQVLAQIGGNSSAQTATPTATAAPTATATAP